ncbi:F0F1 ATP synthase subunit B [Candidatus Saganbacteria bacterium]|nr:F0F1 ATP synthase subunit B [Candidatus Saganbacteria bacterium]
MFEIETGMIFWTAISFAVLLAMLYRFVFPPLNALFDQRRQSIEGRIADAEKIQALAQGILAEYKEKLAKSEEQAAAIFEDAKQKSQAFRETALHQAQAEANKIMAAASQEIKMFERRAVGELKKEIAAVVVDVSRRLIKKELPADEQAKLVAASIRELEADALRV